MFITFKYIRTEPDHALKFNRITHLYKMYRKSLISIEQYETELINIVNTPAPQKESKVRGIATEEISGVKIRQMYKKNGQPYLDRCELTLNDSVYVALMSHAEALIKCGDTEIKGYIKDKKKLS